MADQTSGGQAPQWGLQAFTAAIYDRLDELAAVGLTAVSIVLALGMLGWSRGVILDPIIDWLWRWLGLGAITIPLLTASLGLRTARRALGKPTPIRYSRIISMELALFAALALFSLTTGLSLEAAFAGWGGGLVGWGLGTLVADMVTPVGAAVFFSLLFIGFAGYVVVDRVRRGGGLQHTLERIEQVEAEVESGKAAPVRGGRRQRRLPAEFRKDFEVPTELDDRAASLASRGGLPPIDLLERGQGQRVTSQEINRTAGMIEKTLSDFGIPAKVVSFRTGPSITQFAVEPGYVEHAGSDGEIRRSKVRVSQITALADDLALVLSAPRLRIEAPVPGQTYVGVEVPNRHGAQVRLRPLLESEAFQTLDSPLALALGRDVAGASVAADLAAMPHLLIAGTTGSGKSVAITAFTTCLALNNRPEDLRLVMIDPKRVELIRFNGLPHLFGRVETDLDRIVGVLRWCTLEMDRRYRLLEEARARDLEAFNRRAARSRAGETLPRIVVLMDELADLMMMAPDQTERTLVRLAQMARAVGIHLVVATQRPSTDIVTGLIKANFPARMSFATASSTDSRVILDTPGAESLLGRGDMLYLAPEATSPIRIQGAYVSDQEVEALIHHWRQLEETEAEPAEAPWEAQLAREEVLDEYDDLVEQAIKLVRSEGEASASLLQRRLRIGYPRAARLMDELEELGVIGRPQTGGKTREVLISGEEDPLTPEDPDEAG